MPDAPNPELENLKAVRARLEEKLKKPGLSEDAKARTRIHLDGFQKPGHPDYCEGVIPAIKALEGAK